jgi:hypothetical protein
MKREKLLGHLIHLRELHLKTQAAHLKTRARHLKEVRDRHEQARLAAAQALDDAAMLADLATFGHARLRDAKLAMKVEVEVRALSEKVGHARKLTESAREARAELRRARINQSERSMETEAEHFFSWKKDVSQ